MTSSFRSPEGWYQETSRIGCEVEDFRGNRLAVFVPLYEDEIRSVEGPDAIAAPKEPPKVGVH